MYLLFLMVAATWRGGSYYVFQFTKTYNKKFSTANGSNNGCDQKDEQIQKQNFGERPNFKVHNTPFQSNFKRLELRYLKARAVYSTI